MHGYWMSPEAYSGGGAMGAQPVKVVALVFKGVSVPPVKKWPISTAPRIFMDIHDRA